MANRWGIPKFVEDFVKARDTNCVYCGVSFTDSIKTNKTRPTWEHIINDIRKNGTENVSLCCNSCNSSKGSKNITDWFNSKYCKKKELIWKVLLQSLKNS